MVEGWEANWGGSLVSGGPAVLGLRPERVPARAIPAIGNSNGMGQLKAPQLLRVHCGGEGHIYTRGCYEWVQLVPRVRTGDAGVAPSRACSAESVIVAESFLQAFHAVIVQTQ